MKSRGQALVEFALVAFLAVLLLVGVIHGFFVFQAANNLGKAAEAGAEAAALLGRDGPAVAEAVESTLDRGFIHLPYSYTVVISGTDPGCARVGDMVRVRVGYAVPVRFIFWDVTLRPQQAVRFVERDCGFEP